MPLASLRQHHAAGPASSGGSGPAGQGTGPTAQGGASGAAARPAGGTARPSATPARKTVFKKGELNVTAPFAKPVFDELCSIEQAAHPNAVTVLLRVFIERSMRAYANKMSMSVRNRTLPQLIGDVLAHLKSADATLSLPAIERVVNSGQQHAQMGILNTVIHDPDAFASAADVLMIAETFRDFLRAVWSRL